MYTFVGIAHAATFAPLYAVTATRFEALCERVGKLAKRAQKLGLTPPRCEVVQEFTVPVLARVNVRKGPCFLPIVKHESEWVKIVDTGAVTEMRRFRLIGQAPKLEGWTFRATLEHLGDETLVKATPGFAVPHKYRSTGPLCEHCRVERKRGETFVLEHDDGRMMQVGRQCLRDFLGHQDPNKAASYAESLGALADECSAAEGSEDDGEGGYGHSVNAWNLRRYLAYVAGMIRVCKAGWVSRKVARERDDLTSTADAAYSAMFPGLMVPRDEIFHPSEEDHAKAAAALAWAQEEFVSRLAAEREAEAPSVLNDYQYNLAVAVKLDYVVRGSMGIVASVIAAHNRHLGLIVERKARAESVYVGTVGKREKFLGLTVSRIVDCPSVYGCSYMHFFIDIAGNTLVWKASSERLEVGGVYDLTATVKSHEVYEKTGVKQTWLSRAKAVPVVKVEEAAA